VKYLNEQELLQGYKDRFNGIPNKGQLGVLKRDQESEHLPHFGKQGQVYLYDNPIVTELTDLEKGSETLDPKVNIDELER